MTTLIRDDLPDEAWQGTSQLCKCCLQNIRRDFVSGVLSEEELGNKLHVYIIQHDYAARVHNPRSYDAVSRDVLQRWLFPLCPDTGLLPSPTITASSQLPYARQHIYRCAGPAFMPASCIHLRSSILTCK